MCLQLLIISVNTIYVVLLDDITKGFSSIFNPGRNRLWIEIRETSVGRIASESNSHLHILILGFDGCYIGRAKNLLVPKYVESSICGVVPLIINGECKNEMEFNVGIDKNIGESD